ncbi:hypothetical protein DFJ58DRAFT_738556 [Suillus subalutaceus]|uniref:uncharacterized protein n=1 Tax=Suillus subalutaceus TaxID=48586 RepID=UPI001B8837E6|nr:uncharacterized protein DFJ58DRAFT_738556 [Suillus subalutaceus]KAG1825230.1 hypothetical protein DFJ58DRAFT_738556 [Suillus subalutaceus]
MNYQNYDKAIVLVYGIKLDGWPVGLPFIAPSHLHAVVEWKKLTQQEIEDFQEELQRREEAGEAIGTVRKKCGDVGKPRKRKAPTVISRIPDLRPISGPPYPHP